MSLAYSWENAKEIPTEVHALFKEANDTALHDVSLAIAIPEYKVSLAGGTSPSQNDLFALLTYTGGLISMMVEGKAREDFDVTLGDWKKRTSAKGVKARMADIMDHIGLNKPIPDNIRYQLLHRTASAVIEAKRFHALYAVVLIQSFVNDDAENHFEDFCNFINLFNEKPIKNKLIEISKPYEKQLFAAWVQSKST